MEWIDQRRNGAFAVCAILLAIAATRGTRVDPGFPPFFYQLSLWIALALFVVPVISLAVSAIRDHLNKRVAYRYRAVKRREMPELVEIYRELIGGDHPPINQLKRIQRANGEAFRFYERLVSGRWRQSSEVIGFGAVLPVNRDAAQDLAKGLITGLSLDAARICRVGMRCSAIYIGSVGARGYRGKADVLKCVMMQVDALKNLGARHVYTRPITPDGLRIAKRHGFRPVGAGQGRLGDLYVLDLD